MNHKVVQNLHLSDLVLAEGKTVLSAILFLNDHAFSQYLRMFTMMMMSQVAMSMSEHLTDIYTPILFAVSNARHFGIRKYLHWHS